MRHIPWSSLSDRQTGASKAKEESKHQSGVSYSLFPQVPLPTPQLGMSDGRNFTDPSHLQSPSPTVLHRRLASLQTLQGGESSSYSANTHIFSPPYQPNRYIGYTDNAGNQGSMGDGDSDGEEPSPALLGSLDYHSFLGGTSGRKGKVSLDHTSPFPPIQPTPNYHSSNMSLGSVRGRSPQNGFRAGSSQEALVATPTHPQRL